MLHLRRLAEHAPTRRLHGEILGGRGVHIGDVEVRLGGGISLGDGR